VGQVVEFGSPPARNHSRPAEGRIMKRSLVIAGHKTSISLEEPFWTAFREIALARSQTLSKLAELIDSERCGSNLSSAIRVFVFEHYRTQCFAAAAVAQPSANAEAIIPSIHPINKEQIDQRYVERLERLVPLRRLT
jgi:predicted DNA-binding ribbon-helix-helix protein